MGQDRANFCVESDLSAMINVLIFLAIIFSFQSQAISGLHIISVNGASVFEPQLRLSTPTIYGGTAGPAEPEFCRRSSNSDTCNSCSSAIASCNSRRIYDELMLEIKFRIDGFQGSEKGPVVAFLNGPRRIRLKLQAGSSQSIGVNQTATLIAKWSDICKTLYQSDNSWEVSCENKSLSGMMTIGVESPKDGRTSINGGQVTFKVDSPEATGFSADDIDICKNSFASDAGICNWKVVPRDRSVSLESLHAALDFPNSGELKFNRIRMFVSQRGFTNATPDPLNPLPAKDFELIKSQDNMKYNLKTNTYQGLQNGRLYFFRIGVVDSANNLAYITSANAIFSACSNAKSRQLLHPQSPLPLLNQATTKGNCPFMTTPMNASRTALMAPSDSKNP